MGLKLGDVCITEAGFASDLGAEKFFDIKCRSAGLSPKAAVIVATCRALKYHGGVSLKEVGDPNVEALLAGAENLRVHVENVRQFGVPPIVALNQFPSDTEEELAALEKFCADIGVPAARSRVVVEGGKGGTDLAERVLGVLQEKKAAFQPVYDVEASIPQKVEAIARKVYGADGVDFAQPALWQIRILERLGLDKQPICVAKTQMSLSDEKSKICVPRDWRLQVREVQVRNGAGFIVVVCGEMNLMPGLPKVPAAERIDVRPDGSIVGLS